MTYKPGDSYIDLFTTEGVDGAAVNADSLPTATLVHNGTDDGAVTLTVTNVSAGYYQVTGTIPGDYSRGDKVAVRIAATIAGVATKAILAGFVLDSKRIGDLSDAAAAPTVTAIRQELDANSTKLANLDAAITTRAPASTALSNATWTDVRAARLDHLDADVSTRSVYAGADTSGTTTLLARIGSTITVTAGKVDVNDKTGFKLAADGLDTISTTAPSGVADNFREMVVQTWRRFFRKATKTSAQLKLYADDGTTVVTTQAVSDDGTTQTQGSGVMSLELLDILNIAPPFGTITASEPSVHEQCLVAAQAVIRSLALPGINDDSVVIRKVPWAREFTQGELAFPGIILSPLDHETMDRWRGTNRRDDVGYPVRVSIVDRGNQDLQTNLGRMLAWRQRIARAFRNQRLTDVAEIMTCVVEPHHVYQPEAFDKGIDQSTLTLRFMSREPRGT